MAHVALAVATVPARADWQAAVDLAPPGTPDGAPCQTGLPSVAASKDGSFLVAWQRKLDAAANDNTIIEARLIGRKGELEPLFQLSDGQGNLNLVDTALGRNGDGIVTWHQGPEGTCGAASGPIMLLARRVDATGAAGPVIPVSDPTDKTLRTAVVMHKSGAATVAWIDEIGFGAALKVRQLPADGAPGPVHTLTPTDGVAEEVDLVVDQHDRTLAVWTQHGILQAQRLSPSGDPLQGVTDLTPTGVTSAELDVGIAANGTARVVWSQFGTTDIVSLLTRTIALDGTLGPVEQVASGDDRPLEGQVAVNASGGAALAWFTSPEEASVPDFAFGATISPSGVLSPALTLSGPGVGVDMQPRVALANNGAALATWQRNLGGTGVVEGRPVLGRRCRGPGHATLPAVAGPALPGHGRQRQGQRGGSLGRRHRRRHERDDQGRAVLPPPGAREQPGVWQGKPASHG
jgi:hypothetical protein